MNLNEIYTEVILEQSRNKRNKRDLDNPTVKELGHNPSCGDEITLQLKVDNGKIEDASYTGTGCAISQASTSIMVDRIKDLSYEEALKLANDFIAMVKGEVKDEKTLEELGDAAIFENIQNLPARVKCAVLPWYTLKEIIEKK
ncbi:Fe-S cluster assembly sulfur transfer protein SufU [Peptoniphilus catoniae]|uniref:Fe-S cluster assembly sulfur transfer protein SufU n=1 Tax=Peptoniphilus catoniae TaxID=1660341 RepID=UPI0010FF06EC|nr:SUF system NifU family Fe-S cluster assembly protein [Peptoniphilus catoniae]